MPVAPWQTAILPVIVSAASGKGLTVIAKVEICPSPQSFDPYTDISPDIAELSKSTVIELLVLEPVIPDGKVQT